MHLTLDARLYRASGIGTFLKSIIKFLSSDETISLTLLHYPEDKEALSSINCALISMKSSIYSIKEQLELSLKIPICDLFWSPHFNVPLFPIRAKKRLTTIHDVYHLSFLNTLSMPQKLYAKLFYQASFFLSDGITTPSEFSRKEILKWAKWPPKKLHTIPNALNFQKKERVPTEPFFLCVGNLKPHKNFCRMLEAYLLLKPRESLVIVGKKEGLATSDHTLFQYIETHTFLKEHVRFTGYISDEELAMLYASATLFIFPSYYEGFGYPPLEAMLSLCPVIAASAASIPEVCQDAVEYVDPFSVTSIAQAIERLSSNPQRREELVKNGEKVAKEYTLEKMRDAFLKVIHNL